MKAAPAWWPGGRQSAKAARSPCLDEGGGRQRDVVGRLDRIPRAGDEIGAGVEGIVSELRVDVGGADVAAQAARRPGVGHRRAIAARGLPEVPDGGQEVDIVGAVDAFGRREVVGARFEDRPEILGKNPLADVFGPRRQFETGHDRACDQFHLPGVTGMQRREYRLQSGLPLVAPSLPGRTGPPQDPRAGPPEGWPGVNGK